MTEAEARKILRQFDGAGGVEIWISLQHWRAVLNGWNVAKDPEGWRFHLSCIRGGLQVSATAPGSSPPAVWLLKE